MKKQILRILCLALVLALLASVFTACGGKDKGDNTDNGGGNSNTDHSGNGGENTEGGGENTEGGDKEENLDKDNIVDIGDLVNGIQP